LSIFQDFGRGGEAAYPPLFTQLFYYNFAEMSIGIALNVKGLRRFGGANKKMRSIFVPPKCAGVSRGKERSDETQSVC
jgi:hypothetical protein